MLLVVLYLVKNSQSAVDISECVVLEEWFDEYRYDPGDVQHVQESHRHDHRSGETLQVLPLPGRQKYKTFFQDTFSIRSDSTMIASSQLHVANIHWNSLSGLSQASLRYKERIKMNFKRPLNVLTFKDNIEITSQWQWRAGRLQFWLGCNPNALLELSSAMYAKEKNTFDFNIHNFTM